MGDNAKFAHEQLSCALCMQVQEIAQDAVGRCLQGCPLQTLWSTPSAGGAPVQPLQESHRGGAAM